MIMAAALVSACQTDDTDFSEFINGGGDGITTIHITYSGSSVSIKGDSKGYVTTSGADVTVNTGNDTDSLLLVLSGTTTDGSFAKPDSGSFTISEYEIRKYLEE